jgi:hypothetical protein
MKGKKEWLVGEKKDLKSFFGLVPSCLDKGGQPSVPAVLYRGALHTLWYVIGAKAG